MNANSKPKAPSLSSWLIQATAQLTKAGIPSARLDAEVLLADFLAVERTWLLSHGDEPLPGTRRLLDERLERRTQRVPLAYLIGYKEFYGHRFIVTPDVLIPRPDTELLVEQLLAVARPGMKMLDIGTGSGAIAVTIALEQPSLQVEACDISPDALAVARRNATALNAAVHFFTSDLLTAAHGRYDLIAANLPYVDRVWQRSAETEAEPALALFADDDGLALIKRCITQAHQRLRGDGLLFLEADPRQHDAIIDFAHQHNLDFYGRQGFIVTLQANSRNAQA